jgi:hypothetical protein
MRNVPCLALLVPVALGGAACSTSYAPQNSGRISVVMEGGSMALNKNGKTYRIGPFGGTVDEAVAGNPRAESEASAYQSQQTTGTIFAFTGGALEAAGAGLLVAHATGSGTDSALGPSLGLMLGGLAAEFLALIVLSSAQPHLWDAVNIYNDGVKEPSRAGAP